MLKLIISKFQDGLSFAKKPKNSTEKQLLKPLGQQIAQKEISFILHNQRVDDVAIPKADIAKDSIKTVSYTHLTLPTTPYV